MNKFFLTAFFSTFCFLSVVVNAAAKELIGISLPTKSSLRWIKDGDSLKSALEKKQYKVDVQFAEDDIPNQISQIESMITREAKALIIAPVDDSTLAPVLEQAASKGIKVISYDRLIRNTSSVDYYLTFDNFKVGVLQAQSLLEGLEYPKNKGPFHIELFGGSPDDRNAFFFYDGAMSVLQPLIDSGVLIVKSGQVGMKKVGTLRWSIEAAQARMDNILSSSYSDGSRVDAVLTPTDFLARSIISSLKGVGYGTPEHPWPIISGQDAETPSITAIVSGEQYSTVFKDVRELAHATANLIDELLSGKVNQEDQKDRKSYDNGIKIVPTQLLDPVLVFKSNYKKILIDSGYVAVADLK